MADVYEVMPKFHFQLEWGGGTIAFTEVTGLERETEVIEYRDGSMPEYSKLKIPGMTKYANITMKKGVFPADNGFFDWINTTSLNKVDRRDLTISLLNSEHKPVMVWKVKNAWPSKLTSTDLKADGNEIAIETLEVVHEGLIIQND